MRRLFLALFPLLSLATFATAVAGCDSQNTGQKPVAQPDSGVTGETVAPSAFVVANWNLEWFGSPTEGPTDDALQATNVAKVMKAIDADLWSMQEVVDPAAFKKLGSDVPGFEALPSSDETVEGGPQVYANPGEQKLGIVYRTSRVSVKSARLILRDDSGNFNYRAPMEVELETKPGKTPITVIVVHLAQGTDAATYEKRKASSVALKTYLDAKPAGALVMIAGDWNDGLASSYTVGQPSPYTNFLEDPAYTFSTKDLKSSRYPRVIDHQLVTDDFAAFLVAATAKVTDGSTLVTNFVDTTSDHDPVTVRYDLP